MKLLIKNADIMGGGKLSDILIEDGKIAAVGQDLECDNIIDAAGLTALPGLVDIHCHLREPGFEYKDDIAHGIASAAVGGFTDIACMPNTNPVNDNKTVTTYINKMSSCYTGARVHPVAAASIGLKGELLTEMLELKEFGAVAFSDDGRPISNPAFMRRVLTYAKMTGLPVMSHCEDISLTKNAQMNEGAISTMLGLKGYPAIAEEIMIARDIQIAEYVEGRLHICHISTARGIELVRDAKKRGVRVTCEATPHHFSLNEEACIGFDTMVKVSPPLRTETDRLAIIEGFADGTIDAIATDHAPHHPDEKNQEFDVAANGIVGFETAFALAYTKLVKPGHITIKRLAELMSAVPREIIGLPKMDFSPGNPADFILCDTSASWIVDPSLFTSKAKNTPFGGMELTGRVMSTFISGNEIVRGSKIIS